MLTLLTGPHLLSPCTASATAAYLFKGGRPLCGFPLPSKSAAVVEQQQHPTYIPIR